MVGSLVCGSLDSRVVLAGPVTKEQANSDISVRAVLTVITDMCCFVLVLNRLVRTINSISITYVYHLPEQFKLSATVGRQKTESNISFYLFIMIC